jgi:WD40 repeat protein
MTAFRLLASSASLFLLLCYSPELSRGDSGDPFHSCKVLTLTSRDDLPTDGILAVTSDANTLAFLRSVPNGLEIRIVRRSDHSENTFFLPVPISQATVPKLEFSPDGSRIVVVNGPRLWAISSTSGKTLFEFAIEPDRFFGQISVSNVSVATEIRELKSHMDTFQDVLLLDRGGQQAKSFTLAALHLESIFTLRLSPDGRLLAVLARNNGKQQSSVVMLDTAGALVWQSRISTSFDIQWTPDGKALLVKGTRIREFDAGTGKAVGHPTEELRWVDEYFRTNSTLEIDPSTRYIAALFYHYNPVTRFFDMGPDDPGWEFRLYQHGREDALCRAKITIGRMTNMLPPVAPAKSHVWRDVRSILTDNQGLVAIGTEEFFDQGQLEQRRMIFTYHIPTNSQR